MNQEHEDKDYYPSDDIDYEFESRIGTEKRKPKRKLPLLNIWIIFISLTIIFLQWWELADARNQIADARNQIADARNQIEQLQDALQKLCSQRECPTDLCSKIKCPTGN